MHHTIILLLIMPLKISFFILKQEEYGGSKTSVNELSNVLTQMSSVDPALG